MTDLEKLLTSELLVQVHDLRFAIPKGSTFIWQDAWDAEWDTPPDARRKLFTIMKPIWKQLSVISSLPNVPPSDHPTYLQQCCALTWIYDQAGAYFKGADIRWGSSYFRPILDQFALALYRAKDSPFKLETWLDRGWTFEDYILRINALWAPFVHSESYMVHHWHDINKVILYDIRDKVQAHTGVKDPSADTEEQDEQDPELFDRLISNPPSEVTSMAEFVYTLQRIMVAHVGVINRFGRYPYRNDSVGRDFKDGEQAWLEKSTSFKRLDPTLRDTIRKDVDDGVWTPLQLDYDLDG